MTRVLVLLLSAVLPASAQSEHSAADLERVRARLSAAGMVGAREAPAVPVPRPVDVPSAASSDDEALRPALSKRMEADPVARELVAPTLRDRSAAVIVVRGESEGGGAGGGFAYFDWKTKELVIDREKTNQHLGELDLLHQSDASWTALDRLAPGRPPTAAQIRVIAHDFLPVLAHELTHARHAAELRALGVQDVSGIVETEVYAFEIEAMVIAAERRRDPGFLSDETTLAREERDLEEVYRRSRGTPDPSLGFRALIDEKYSSTYNDLLRVSGRSDEELGKVEGTIGRIRRDCAASLASPACGEDLDAVSRVLSDSGREELAQQRALLASHPDCGPCARRIGRWVDVVADGRTGGSPGALRVVGRYYRREAARVEAAGR